MRGRKFPVALTLVLVGVLFFLTACERSVDLSGTWTGTLVIPPSDSGEGAVFVLSLILTQEGTALSGQLGLAQQAPVYSILMPIADGSFAGDSVSIRADGAVLVDHLPVPVAVFLTGTYSAAGLSGVGTYTAAGNVIQVTWSAHRI